MSRPSTGTKKPQASPQPLSHRERANTKRVRDARFEFSAGGLVIDGDRLLMVKVQNLEGEERWTFPKGHIEKGESAATTALREVEEETGYRCQIGKPFERVQYFFYRKGRLTKKTVTWFLMKPLEKTGAPDPEEILDTAWLSIPEAEKRASYKSDKKLLAKLKTPSARSD